MLICLVWMNLSQVSGFKKWFKMSQYFLPPKFFVQGKKNRGNELWIICYIYGCNIFCFIYLADFVVLNKWEIRCERVQPILRILFLQGRSLISQNFHLFVGIITMEIIIILISWILVILDILEYIGLNFTDNI